MWIIYALLSAVFAALTTILAKIGVENVDSTLATAIRTAVVLVMAWGMVFLLGKQGGVSAIGAKSWVFLTLSGLATGGSWLFYYKALQMGEASRVAPIDKLSVVITMILAFVVLHETVTVKGVIGGIQIAAGTLFMILLYILGKRVKNRVESEEWRFMFSALSTLHSVIEGFTCTKNTSFLILTARFPPISPP